MSNHKLIVGNWKTNPSSLEDAKRIARQTRMVVARLDSVEAVICPPFLFIEPCVPRKKAKHFSVGAQSVSVDNSGAHTGQVGAYMLSSIGVEYVIVGHSEERETGDDDIKVSKKVASVLGSGMKAILCVGEKDRDEQGSHFGFLSAQIKASLEGVPMKYADDIILAYEPVWAIGADDALDAEKIREMSIFIRKVLVDIFGLERVRKMKVLYGGSVNPTNASDIVSQGQVDGLLIGRASVGSMFVDILKSVDELGG